MNIRLLKAFLMLAEKRNYADAARALFISQPALTKQINLLESLVETSLFTRGRHGATLTGGGRRLLPEAEKVVRQSRLFMHHAEWGSVSQVFILHHAVWQNFVGSVRG